MPDITAGSGVAFREAIDFLRARLALDEKDWLSLIREADRAARDRASGMSDALVRDILDAIKDAMAKGTTAGAFRETFDRLLRTHGWSGDNTAGWRSDLTFRVLTGQAAGAGRWRQIERLAARRPWIRYVTAGDARVRPQHAAWHGVILRWDDPWWDTHFPPNGFNCRCHAMSLSDADLKRFGWTPTPQAPPSDPVIRFTRINGVVRPVETPAGIDPGFAFNPGKLGLKPQDPGGGLFGHLPRQWPPVPSSEAEAITLADRIAEGQAEWEATLSAFELDAIEAYKGVGYRPVNMLLRGEDIDEDDLDYASDLAETLTGALDRARLPRAVTTFRGVPAEIADESYAYKAGEEFTEPSFVSSSLLEENAFDFGDFIIEAVYPPQTEAIALVHFLPHVMNAEIEMLLAPGKRFRVLARRKGRMLVEIVS